MLRAIDTLDVNWQRILASQQRTILAARVLDVEIRQFEQGIRTSTDVLNAQASLANAQLDEISAIAEYQIAQVDIAFAAGMIRHGDDEVTLLDVGRLLRALRATWLPPAPEVAA